MTTELRVPLAPLAWRKMADCCWTAMGSLTSQARPVWSCSSKHFGNLAPLSGGQNVKEKGQIYRFDMLWWFPKMGTVCETTMGIMCDIEHPSWFGPLVRWSAEEKSRLADGPRVHAANKGESPAAKHCDPSSGAVGKAGTPTAPSTAGVCTMFAPEMLGQQSLMSTYYHHVVRFGRAVNRAPVWGWASSKWVSIEVSRC